MDDINRPVLTDSETDDSSSEEVTVDEVPTEEESTPTNNVFENKSTKSIEDVAKEVLSGTWGYGVNRRQALADAGYDPNEVQNEMIRIVNNNTST